MAERDLSRLKLVLAEKKRAGVWLAHELGGGSACDHQMVLQNHTAIPADFEQDC